MTGKLLLAAGAAAAVLAFAGAADAQSIGGRATPQAPAETPAPPPSAPAVEPPASVGGHDFVDVDVLDPDGHKVGEVREALGDRLIVTTGGLLGIGGREVSIPADRLTISKVGDKISVKTTLTRDEIKALPDYVPEPAR